MENPPSVPDAPSEECDAPDAEIPAQIAITADDTFRLWVNGALIGVSPLDDPESWRRPQLYDVTLLCHPSKLNVIAVESSNKINTNGPDRGLIAEVRFEVAGTSRKIVTDASWRVASMVPVGWDTPSFDDIGMAPAFVIGAASLAPWNDAFAAVAPGSTATWIWLDYPGGDAINKPVAQTMYARRAFRVRD